MRDNAIIIIFNLLIFSSKTFFSILQASVMLLTSDFIVSSLAIKLDLFSQVDFSISFCIVIISFCVVSDIAVEGAFLEHPHKTTIRRITTLFLRLAIQNTK